VQARAGRARQAGGAAAAAAVGSSGSGPLMSPEALAALQHQQEHADRCV
jgi:hypothetical protein